jgi:hypothetical protein
VSECAPCVCMCVGQSKVVSLKFDFHCQQLGYVIYIMHRKVLLLYNYTLEY